MKPKLLIVEIWGLGDLVIATPFIRAASEKYAVTLVAKPFALDLQPRLWPEVRVLPFVAPWTAFTGKYRLWQWPWRGMFRLVRTLAAERFDAGLSARWDPRDHFLLALAGVQTRLGFPRAGSGLYLNQPVTKPANHAHRYEYWSALANALDLKLAAREAIPVPPARRGQILVHTGAGQTVRVWPLERFRVLVRRLRERGFAVQVACDPDQRDWWLVMGELNVVTPLTITDLLRLTDAAGLFIGNDSGPGHLAATTGVPTFTIFGPQLPSRFAPLHPGSEWMAGGDCPHRPCSDFCRFPLARCLWDLSEEMAWQRIGQFVIRHEANLVSGAPVPAFTMGGKVQTAHPLRLLQIFNRYLMPGGEENSAARIADHLELAGHQVTRYRRASAEWNRPHAPARWRQLFLAWNNPAVLNQLREVHEKTKPDAWVCHNLVPVISLGVYRLARELGVPIIHWLHNYRPVSPSGTLRAGNQMLKPDDRFLAWKEVWSGSWRGRFLTAWLALGYARIKRRGDFDTVKAWIALSGDMKRIFEWAGFPPAEKLHVLRHSWDIQPPLAASDGGYFLFLGRMIEDKGVKFLVQLWQRPEFRNVPLVMAGEGPLADFYRNHTPPNIRWVGFVRGEAKRRLIADCRAVLFPCLWTEPLGLVVYEAYEQGRPVLASNVGGLKDTILEGQTGRLLEPGNEPAWVAALQPFIGQPEMSRQMGERGRQWLNENVSPAAWNRQFDEIVKMTGLAGHPTTAVKPKLLIVEIWGLGDLVIATPFIRAASEKYDVTLVAKPFALDLQPRLWPEVRVLPFVAPWTAFTGKYRLWQWPWRGMFHLARTLAAERFDVGLSARWDPRDHFLLSLAGARKRLGFPRLRSQLCLTQPLAKPDPIGHRYEYWRVIARALELALPEREAILQPAVRPDGAVLVHSGAGQPIRVWPLERYRNLVLRLREKNHPVVVACDADQRQWWLQAGETNVATPRTVAELLTLLDHSSLFIGNDSGPGHLAAICGVPTFTLFGPQLPEWFAPSHPAAEWIEGKACPYKPCSDYCRFPTPHCLWNINEEEVWARIEVFVASHSKSKTQRMT